MQKIVGGFIEPFKFASDCAVICNEEGRIMRLPVNCYCVGQLFVGDILLVGIDDDEFCDVPKSLLRLWKDGVLFTPVRGYEYL